MLQDDFDDDDLFSSKPTSTKKKKAFTKVSHHTLSRCDKLSRVKVKLFAQPDL